MPALIDPGAYAHTAEGVDRAERLATHFFANLVDATHAARVDTIVAAAFLLSEVLAGLQFYGGLSAKDAVRQVKHLTAERVAALWQAEAAEDETSARAITDSAPDILAPMLMPALLH